MQKRISWIDQLRGFCILAILWFHTEVYYAGQALTSYAMYVGNVLATFFFLSGYLFYTGKPLNARHRVYSVFRWLLAPYFIFTTTFAIPKSLVHNEFNGFQPIIANILTGHASWFISAFIVSQLLFIAALHFAKGRAAVMIPLALIAATAAHYVGNGYNPSPLYFEQNLWHVNEALLGFFLLSAGYLYHRSVNLFQWQKRKVSLIVFMLAFAACKYIILRHQLKLVFGPIIVSHYPFFIADLLIGILFLTSLFPRLPQLRLLSYTGQHSIAYYFICGGIPLLTAKVLSLSGFPYSGFLSMLSAFLIICVLSTIIVWMIYKYTAIFKKIE